MNNLISKKYDATVIYHSNSFGLRVVRSITALFSKFAVFSMFAVQLASMRGLEINKVSQVHPHRVHTATHNRLTPFQYYFSTQGRVELCLKGEYE